MFPGSPKCCAIQARVSFFVARRQIAEEFAVLAIYLTTGLDDILYSFRPLS
jgi:hypothetical protein